jgi:hypothetical protein
MSLSRPLLALAIGIAWLAAVPAAAQEVVYFTNGTTMVAHSHALKDGMIELTLSTNARIAFPQAMVEKIEKAGREVYGTGSRRANVAAAGADGVTVRYDVPDPGPLSAAESVPSRYRESRHGEPGRPEDLDARDANAYVAPTRSGPNGLETAYPFVNHPNRKVREIGVVGRVGAPRVSTGGDGLAKGATGRLGSKMLLDPPGGAVKGARGRPGVTRVGLIGGTPVAPPQPPPTGEQAEGDESASPSDPEAEAPAEDADPQGGDGS